LSGCHDRREIWGRPARSRFCGSLPSAVEGEFPLRLRTLFVSLKYVAGTSLPGTRSLLDHFGIVISPAEHRLHPARRGRPTEAGTGGDLSGRLSGRDHVYFLLGDDATQWRHLSDEFERCWIHAGRQYAKSSLVPLAFERILLKGWQQTLRQRLKEPTLSALRLNTHRGRPLGSDGFLSKIESLVGRRLRPLPIGRPRR